MLKTITKTAAASGLALVVALGGLSLGAGQAEAGSRTGKYIAAAGLGVVAGALIANAARDRHYGGYEPHYDGYYRAPRARYYAPAPRVHYQPYEPRDYYYDGYDAPSYSYATPTGQDENRYGGYDCGSAGWNAYDTGSSSTNVGVGGNHCR